MERVTIRVPASTSNLGPGFDCLGVALRLYNEITIARSQKCLLPQIVRAAADKFFKRAKVRPFAFSCSVLEKIPRMRGLGSSATIRLGVLSGLNQLGGSPLDRFSLFRICAELEGHPDNAAPASFGGFTVVRGEGVQSFKVSPRLKFVLLVPDFAIETPAARKILPDKIKRSFAIGNCQNACAITAAFASSNYEKLRGAFGDHLHQPFRSKLIPVLPNVISAAEKAGALGAFLSGSGSTICAIMLGKPQPAAAAMQRASKLKTARTIVTTADNQGLQLEKN